MTELLKGRERLRHLRRLLTLYDLLAPLWIDLEVPHRVACRSHRRALDRPALILGGAGRDLRDLAFRQGRNVCEVHA